MEPGDNLAAVTFWNPQTLVEGHRSQNVWVRGHVFTHHPQQPAELPGQNAILP